MIVWRVLPVDPAAASDAAGGPLWFPRELQGAARHDNPGAYGCLYVAQEAASAVAEALAPFRGRGALTPAMLERAGRRLSLVGLHLREPDRTARPRRPRDAGRRGPAAVGRRHARARERPSATRCASSRPTGGRRACAGGRRSRRRGSTSPSSIARGGGCGSARSSCWVRSTRPCASPPASWGWRERGRGHPCAGDPDAVRGGARQLLPRRGRPAHARRRRPQLGDVADDARGGAGRARPPHRGPRADRHHPPAHRPHRAGGDPGRPLRRRGVRARRAGAVAGALLGGHGGRRRLRRGDHAAPRHPAGHRHRAARP